ncbi:MAG: DUF1080 domain-containing protein [Methanomassiliicoccus sp.]|nr:MAG: DUF1080 domain-containing protein [Methanomassiliicoccus sp.]
MTTLIQCPCAKTGDFTIPSSVTTIGDHAFESCTSLTSITIPGSVTLIGYGAFQSCSSLTSITIPSSVTTIGSNGFALCISLTSATISEGVTSIGASAFAYCHLTSVTIPGSVTTIGSGAFQKCFALTSMTFLGLEAPTSVGSSWIRDTNAGLQGHAYYASNFPAPGGSFNGLIMGAYIPEGYTYTVTDGKANITGYLGAGGDVTIPSTLGGCPVIAIGDHAFLSNANITSVIIPDSVTTIGYRAFYYSIILTSVTIGNGVTTIGNSAFSHCSALTSVTIPDSVTTIGSSAFSYCSDLTSVTIPDSVNSIGNYAFQYCTSLSSVTIGKGVASIAFNAFSYCPSLTVIDVDPDNPNYASVSGVLYSKDMTMLIHCPGGFSGPLVIPDSVTSILYHAFAWSAITSVTIPDSVTSIGDYAFRECQSLTSVTIGSGITAIGNYAFIDCYALSSVTIGSEITAISEYAFAYCYSLTSITIPDSVASIEYGAFARSALTSVTIPSSVTTIGGYAFYECTSLTSVAFHGLTAPTSVGTNWISGTSSTIRGHAYEVSDFPPTGSSFNGLTMGSYLTCDYTFTFDGSQVTITGYSGSGGTIIIPTEIGGYPVAVIGDRSFQNNGNITSLTIPISVDFIGEWAFDHCSALDSVIIIGSGSTIIGSCAFQASSVKTVVIGGGVRTIGEHAFGNCHMTSFTIEEGLETICLQAFDYSSISEGIFLPSTVTSISSMENYMRTMGAFFYCTLPAIGVDEDNPVYASLDGVLYDKAMNTLLVYPNGRLDVSFTVPGTVSLIDNYSFQASKYLISLIVPGSVNAINLGAFSGCLVLSSVTMENGLTVIGKEAFYSCYSLSSVTFPESLTSIGDGAFWDCRSLAPIDLPDDLVSIGATAFYHCPIITLDIPDGVITIGSSAFSTCTSLVSVSLGTGVMSMSGAFSGCSALTAINVDAGNLYYASIDGVLYNKIITALIKYPSAKPDTSYVMPNTVTLIVSNALIGCSNMLSLTLSDDLERIEGRSIGCAYITSLTIPGGVTYIGSRAFSNCYALLNIDFLGITPPVGDDPMMLGTPTGALGHAYYASGFPAPGERFGGLMMGSYLADVTFSQTGVDASNTGIVLTVDGTTYLASQMPITFTWYSGSMHSFEWSQAVSIDSETRFGWQSSSGLYIDPLGTITVPDTGGSISAVYATQHIVSFIATGLDSDAGANTVLTVGATTYNWNDIPIDIWINDGTTFWWSSTVPATGGKVFTLIQRSGLSSPILASGTETADYFKSLTISGHVYISGTTTGAADWHVQLWQDGSQFGPDIVTDASGAYSFTVTLPGTYQIREVLKDGWTETSPILTYSPGDDYTPSVLGYDEIIVTSGIDVTGLDIENFENVLVSGYKYEYLSVFRDGFNDGDYAGWSTLTNDWNVNGGLLQRVIGDFGSRIRYDVSFDDYTFEADARLIDVAGYALIFRVSNDFGDFYSFQYDPGAGGLKLSKFTGYPTESTLAGPLAFGFDDDWHHLKVSVSGNHIICYIDSVKVFDVTDASSPILAGGIGFRTWAWNTEAEFDNVCVTDISTPLDDWEITLTKSGDGSTSVLTGDGAWNDGYYEFTITSPGEYAISEVLKDGWTRISPANDYTFTVESGDDDIAENNFFNFEWLTVSGTKFFDADGDGHKDPSEPGLQYWTISMFREGIEYRTPVETGGSGHYEFLIKDPGTYTISETTKPFWERTYPIEGTHEIEVRSGMDQTGLDFGNWLGDRAIVTNCDLGVFDVDGNPSNGRQFKLIFTPDVPDNPTKFRLTASNPGQFTFNVFFVGFIGEGDTFIIDIPFPFVTQGADPVHAYSSLNTGPLGWLVPGTDVSYLFGISPTAISWAYDGQSKFGDVAEITLTAKGDYSGFLYINVHLDYGLKKNIGALSPDYSNDAEGALLTIEEGGQYAFSVTGPGDYFADDAVMNTNSFKINPGFGGLVLDEDGDPVVGATVEIWLKNDLIGTAVTDDDGWYMFEYKHIGRSVTYTLKLYIDGGFITEKSVTVKANSFSMVIFDLGVAPPDPTPPPESPPVKPPKPPKK